MPLHLEFRIIRDDSHLERVLPARAIAACDPWWNLRGHVPGASDLTSRVSIAGKPSAKIGKVTYTFRDLILIGIYTCYRDPVYRTLLNAL